MILSDAAPQMPLWLAIIIAVAGSIVGIFGGVGISAYLQKRMEHKAEVKNRKEDEKAAKEAEEKNHMAELQHKEYLSELRKIIREENEASVAPIRGRLEKLEGQLDIVAAGTTDILRERLLSTYYKCIEKGFRTQYDYENVEHMHKEYVGLGGNSFVQSCVDAIKALPSEAEFNARKKANRKPKPKKQVLLENK